jgi:hypothetical protein
MRRGLRIFALTYLVKTVLIVAAWIAIPDLPERAMNAWRTAMAAIP